MAFWGEYNTPLKEYSVLLRLAWKGKCKIFTINLSQPVLAKEELGGSKLVAALDRQHPRDWWMN